MSIFTLYCLCSHGFFSTSLGGFDVSSVWPGCSSTRLGISFWHLELWTVDALKLWFWKKWCHSVLHPIYLSFFVCNSSLSSFCIKWRSRTSDRTSHSWPHNRIPDHVAWPITFTLGYQAVWAPQTDELCQHRPQIAWKGIIDFPQFVPNRLKIYIFIVSITNINTDIERN